MYKILIKTPKTCLKQNFRQITQGIFYKQILTVLNVCVYIYYGFINVVIHQKRQFTKAKAMASEKNMYFPIA